MFNKSPIKYAKDFIQQFNSYLNGQQPFKGNGYNSFSSEIHSNFSFVDVNANGIILKKYAFIKWIEASNIDLKSKLYHGSYECDPDSFKVINKFKNDIHIISCCFILQPTFTTIFCQNNDIKGQLP
eukprot:895935_1